MIDAEGLKTPQQQC